MHIIWETKPFEALSKAELYAVLQLRVEVFVVEQNCPFQDLDGKDFGAYHCLAWEGSTLVAYCRLLPAGLAYAEPSIGRVVSKMSHRRFGLGKSLMQKAIAEGRVLWGAQPIRIGAQLYLKQFYEGFGFVQSSEAYLEDGILHIEMLLE